MSLCVSSKLSKLLSGVWCKCERVIFRFSLSLINWKKETKTQRNVGSVVKSSVKPGLYIKVRHLYLRNTNLNFVHYQNSFSNCSSRTCRMLYTNFNQEKQISNKNFNLHTIQTVLRIGRLMLVVCIAQKQITK